MVLQRLLSVPRGPPVGLFRGLESSPHALSLETWEENVALSWQGITVGAPGGDWNLRLGKTLVGILAWWGGGGPGKSPTTPL